jgi:hypothetical protein
MSSIQIKGNRKWKNAGNKNMKKENIGGSQQVSLILCLVGQDHEMIAHSAPRKRLRPTHKE